MRGLESKIKFDLDSTLKALEKVKREFTIFGGEPLMLDLKNLETFFRYGYEKFKKNGVQTNGSLITKAHIDLFKRYNVHVGFSIDGPGDLNAARAGDMTTLQCLTALDDCMEAGLRCSLITVVHKFNARKELKDWLEDLGKKGITGINLHWLTNHELCLENPEEVWKDLWYWSRSTITSSKFTEMEAMLGDPEKAQACCLWKGCDPCNTTGVHGIDADGSLINCGRVNLDGVNWRKSNTTGSERYFVLYNTPQEHGGCKGCRFFLACKGECPGNAIDQDWRNRSSFCSTLKVLFGEIEKCVEKPVSLNTDREQLEKKFLTSTPKGNRAHKDHDDIKRPNHGNVPHGNVPHGNRPHTRSLKVIR